jgi:hypothetical protein
MEDQRSRTDLPFKTYSTPLELPFPVEVGPGEQFRQHFVLSMVVERGVISAPEESPAKIIISAGSTRKRVPRIGLSAASNALPHSSSDRERLARLRLNHLRVDLRFSDSHWKTLLHRARETPLPSAVAYSVRSFSLTRPSRTFSIFARRLDLISLTSA